MTHLLHFSLTNTMEGFWEDEYYNKDKMYEGYIPWVATRSMTFALQEMHEYRVFAAEYHNQAYDINPDEHFPIGDWMKKIEMLRTAPVWGFCDLDKRIYLVQKDIYSGEEDADLPDPPTNNYKWDIDVEIIADFDPTNPDHIAETEAAAIEDGDYWDDEDEEEENDYDRFYVGRRLFEDEERILDESFHDSLNVQISFSGEQPTRMLSFITDFNVPMWIA